MSPNHLSLFAPSFLERFLELKPDTSLQEAVSTQRRARVRKTEGEFIPVGLVSVRYGSSGKRCQTGR